MVIFSVFMSGCSIFGAINAKNSGESSVMPVIDTDGTVISESPDSSFIWSGTEIAGISSLAKNVTEIAIPEKATSIRNGAFMGMHRLEKVIFPVDSDIKIGKAAFKDCTSLKQVYLPSGLKNIQEDTFSCCISLEDIELPYRLKEIWANAFSGCTALKEISIPYGVNIIYPSAFAGCTSLEKVVLPGSVKEIRYNAFNACSSLKEIDLSHCSVIGEAAFFDCSSLKNIELAPYITSISKNAFAYCVSLEKVTVPESLTEFENGIFSGCSKLTEVFVTEGSEADLNFSKLDVADDSKKYTEKD